MGIAKLYNASLLQPLPGEGRLNAGLNARPDSGQTMMVFGSSFECLLVVLKRSVRWKQLVSTAGIRAASIRVKVVLLRQRRKGAC